MKIYERKKLLFAVVLAAVLVLWYCVSAIEDLAGFGGNSMGIYIEISSGETLKEITAKLEDNKIINHKKRVNPIFTRF